MTEVLLDRIWVRRPYWYCQQPCSLAPKDNLNELEPGRGKNDHSVPSLQRDEQLQEDVVHPLIELRVSNGTGCTSAYAIRAILNPNESRLRCESQELGPDWEVEIDNRLVRERWVVVLVVCIASHY